MVILKNLMAFEVLVVLFLASLAHAQENSTPGEQCSPLGNCIACFEEVVEQYEQSKDCLIVKNGRSNMSEAYIKACAATCEYQGNYEAAKKLALLCLADEINFEEPSLEETIDRLEYELLNRETGQLELLDDWSR